MTNDSEVLKFFWNHRLNVAIPVRIPSGPLVHCNRAKIILSLELKYMQRGGDCLMILLRQSVYTEKCFFSFPKSSVLTKVCQNGTESVVSG